MVNAIIIAILAAAILAASTEVAITTAATVYGEQPQKDRSDNGGLAPILNATNYVKGDTVAVNGINATTNATLLNAGLFIVTSLSEDTIAGPAAPGNRAPNYIIVSVTDARGVPVTGLTAANFRVDAMIVGPGGAVVNIVRVAPGGLPGFYYVDVVPTGTQTWKAGVYIFAIAVSRGSDQGQTLASVLMD